MATRLVKPERTWLGFALAAMFFFGVTNFILGFIAEKNTADPAANLAAAMILWLGTGLLGAVALVLFLAAGKNFASLTGRRTWYLPVAAGVMLALGMFLLKTGLASSPLAKGPLVAVSSSNSLIVALLAWLVLAETLSPGHWAGFLVILAGIVMVSLGGTAVNHFNAIGYAFLAMLCFGLTNFFLKLAGARGCDSIAAAIVLWLSVGTCGVLAASWHLLHFSRIPLLARNELSWLALLAGVLLALGMLAIKKAVTLGPAGPAAAVSGSNAIVVSILDVVVLGHWLPFLKLAGMLAVIVGIVAFALAKPGAR